MILADLADAGVDGANGHNRAFGRLLREGRFRRRPDQEGSAKDRLSKFAWHTVKLKNPRGSGNDIDHIRQPSRPATSLPLAQRLAPSIS
jgi:hypothetical protein